MQVKGIVQLFGVPGTPQYQGLAERANRTIAEMGHVFMFAANLPSTFWVLAYSTAVFIKNRLPTRHNENNITPY